MSLEQLRAEGERLEEEARSTTVKVARPIRDIIAEMDPDEQGAANVEGQEPIVRQIGAKTPGHPDS